MKYEGKNSGVILSVEAAGRKNDLSTEILKIMTRFELSE